MVYDHVSGDTPTLSSFEIPWAFGRFVREDKKTRVCLLDEARNIPLSTTYLYPPKTTITKHPMAFTCREALGEVMMDYQSYNPKQVVLAFVANEDIKIKALAPDETHENIWLKDKKRVSVLIQLLLDKKLPAEARVRIYLGSEAATRRRLRPSVYSPSYSPSEMLTYFTSNTTRDFPTSLDRILRHLIFAAELEFVVPAGEGNKLTTFCSIQGRCNEYLRQAQKLRQIEVSFRDDPELWVLTRAGFRESGDESAWRPDASSEAKMSAESERLRRQFF